MIWIRFNFISTFRGSLSNSTGRSYLLNPDNSLLIFSINLLSCFPQCTKFNRAEKKESCNCEPCHIWGSQIRDDIPNESLEIWISKQKILLYWSIFVSKQEILSTQFVQRPVGFWFLFFRGEFSFIQPQVKNLLSSLPFLLPLISDT